MDAEMGLTNLHVLEGDWDRLLGRVRFYVQRSHGGPRALPPGETTETLAQCVMVELWQRRESGRSFEVRSPDSAARLILTIARMRAIDMWRRFRREREVQFGDGLEGLSSSRIRGGAQPEPTPTQIERRHEFERRREAVEAGLAARYRRVLAMVELEGLTYTEAGLRLGMPGSKIKNLYHYAVRLRKRFLERWFEAG